MSQSLLVMENNGVLNSGLESRRKERKNILEDLLFKGLTTGEQLCLQMSRGQTLFLSDVTCPMVWNPVLIVSVPALAGCRAGPCIFWLNVFASLGGMALS